MLENASCQSLYDLELLIVILAKFPVSGNENLRSLSIKSITRAIVCFVEKSIKSLGVHSDGLVKPIEIVLDTVRRLLKITWDLERGNVGEELNAALAEAAQALSFKNPQHRRLQLQMGDLLDELEKPWGIKYSNVKDIKEETVVNNKFTDWRNCSIGWLSDLTKFQPNLLPVFKVPDTKYSGVYPNSDDYFDTVTKVWVAMTFGDGNSIISPHCKHLENGKECGRLFWKSDGTDQGGICRSKGCNTAAVLICGNKFHKYGLCEKCAQDTRNNLKGPPGPKASSHIYDGIIVKKSFDNRIFIREVKSRKPPKDAIHWKTTSRLKSSNLVGIVFLPNRGAGLSSNDKIVWAEIGFHSDSKSEHLERSKGNLVVSVLKEVFLEKVIHPSDGFQLDPGANVAIVDCQTFSPEFIPVLKALENQRNSFLPLASSLNIGTHSGAPVYDDTNINSNSDDGTDESVDSFLAEHSYLDIQFPEYDQVSNRILKMVTESNLEPIIKIRRHQNYCSQLVRDLSRLVQGAKLDPDQFDSFIGSLGYQVHCTQGPPGTGKSYVGVVIARALLVVRSLWMKVSPSAGEPPILILSYKNHAIDEFLLDLIKVEPSVKMIRMGNASDPKLSSYSESSVSRSLPFVFKLRNELNALHGRLEALGLFFTCLKGFYLEDEYQADLYDKKTMYKNVDILAKIISWVNFVDTHSSELSSNLNLDMMTNNSSVQLVENLYLGFKHYQNADNLNEILWKFLTNFTPSPKCLHSLECVSIAEQGFNFCKDHRCDFFYGHGNSCSSSVAEGKSYCMEHVCAENDCDLARLDLENQVFCDFHSCYVCLDFGTSANLARGEPPRNTCEFHRLCMSQDRSGQICENLAVLNQSYCPDHEPIRCKALTKRGKQCSDKAMSKQNPYCSNHGPKDNESHVFTAKSSILSGTNLCAAKNAKGKPCKGKRDNDSVYCRDHRNLTIEVAEASSIENSDENSILDNVIGDSAHVVSSSSELVQFVSSILSGTNLCAAKNAKGKPCKGKRDNDSVYCRDHRILTIEVAEASSIENSDENSILDNAIGDSAHVVSSSSELVQFVDVSNNAAGEYETLSIGSDIDLEKNSDSEFEDDNYEHLREIFECTEIDEIMKDECNEIVDIMKESLAEVVIDDDGLSDFTSSPSAWNWDMPHHVRLDVIQRFINYAISLYPQFYTLFEADFKRKQIDYHTAVTESRSAVYEGKSVVAGTIVGCISRLEVIRGTNPFAIVVEEASEVLEPILFSCIGSSTLKLEMIGDQLQLQPCLSAKFEFEKINKIKCSLFERLIRAPEGCRVPYNVLSIQRRMRKEISDFTRSFYSHITEIKDDSLVKTRQIGQDLKSRSCGLNVPGIALDVFFWTHEGAQNKSNVGLSKVNYIEAKMVCNLAKYLVDNGVPKRSIVIITPYKGQLMHIRNDLMKAPYKIIDRYNNDSVRISTVDQFQGDEADIVIVSLVIDGRSTTPFVKLQNRMIVLLSRARIGMYIVGNVSYFEKNPVAHWQKSIELFQTTLTDFEDQQIAHAAGLNMGQSRIGPAIPICCPAHPDEIISVIDVKSLSIGFCRLKCQVNLKCGHACDLDCHWPSLTHKVKCDKPVESPCKSHQEHTITCYDLMHKMNSKSVNTLEMAKEFYLCPVQENFKLPCSHDIKIPCARYQNILLDPSLIPVCKQKSLQPYIYPDCKHELHGNCRSINDYISSTLSAPPCNEKSLYTAYCGHNIQLDCCLKRDLIAHPGKFICSEKVKVRLPRCGHSAMVACRQSLSLDSWEGVSCDAAADGILEGVSYGRVDQICKVPSILKKKCGHEVSMSCEEAFSSSSNMAACCESISITNPTCGHLLKTDCKNRLEIERLLQLNDVEIVSQFTEGSNAFKPCKYGIFCKDSVLVQRKCGHEERMSCKDAQEIKSKCQKEIDIRSPLCGHSIKVFCYDKELEKTPVWDSVEPLSQKNRVEPLNRLFKESVLTQCFFLPAGIANKDDLKTKLLSCTNEVVVARDDCEHKLTMDCRNVFKKLLESNNGKLQLPVCHENVSLPLNCNHLVDTSCSKYQRYLTGAHVLDCNIECEKQCWNFANCGSYLLTLCSSTEIPCCESLSEWKCPQNTAHSFKLNVCSDGIPSACPLCDSEKIVSEIEALESLEINAFSDMPLNIPEEISVFLKNSAVTPEMADLDFAKRFNSMKVQLLERLDEKSGDIWSKSLFKPHTIPCFWASKEQDTSIDLPRNISPSSLNGINVFAWTKESFKQYLDSVRSNVNIIFGYAYSASLLSNPINLPKKPYNTKKNPKDRREKDRLYSDHVSNWVNEWRGVRGYDAVYQASSGSFVFWDPYCICPLIRVKVSKLLADKLLEAIPVGTGKDHQLFVEQKIQFTVPGAAKASRNLTQNIHLARKELLHLKSPISEEWNGKSLFLNSQVKPSIERELFNKLKFADMNRKQDIVMFAGLTYLDTVQKNGIIFPEPEFDLIRCLELLWYNKSKEAQKHFKLYCNKAEILHPLILVAIARGAEKKKNPDEIRSLLTTFSKLYPYAKTKWLTVEESKLIDEAILVSNENREKKDLDLSPKEQWDIWKATEGIFSKSMDELINYVGWKKIQIVAIEIFKMGLALKKMPASARQENMPSLNYCFLGNPGTGKTTAARLLAGILNDCGLRDNPTFIETNARDLMIEGLGGFKKKLGSAKGGTIFIDEAYDLDPANNSEGKPIVSELLSASEKDRSNLSIFLAGYEDDIVKKLFDFNDGLKSRFKSIIFDDFDKDELLQIWNYEVKKRKWAADENVGKVLIRKISKLANRKGFGNARLIRQKVEDATKRAFARPNFNGHMELLMEDVVGVNPINDPKVKKILKDIDGMIGWSLIKKSVKEVVTISSKNYELELKGKPTLPLSLNRLFLGNPGTGKSKCSDFYGLLLKHLNFLSIGDVMWKTASDFVGQYVGESQKKTNSIIESARGKVLVIDEAYALDDKLYGKQVLDVLVEKVHGTEADDIAVILIGYDQQMSQMLRNQNPGLTRRFPRESAFVFEDFNDQELLEIWDRLCGEKNVECTYHVGAKVVSILSQKRNFPNFGNAGTVTNMFNSALSKASLRAGETSKDDPVRIDLNDLEESMNEENDPFEPLSKLFQMESIIEVLQKLQKSKEVDERDGSKVQPIGHFIFRGPPGTGKTTVARAIASILFRLKLINYDKVVETTGRDLTGEYVGQTKLKVQGKLKDAQGGILFVDEAYGLGQGHFGSEAVDTMVAAITDPSYKGLVIILAGYPSDMDNMLNSNPGLKSRFNRFIDFDDWTVSQCLKFIEQTSKQNNFTLEDGSMQVLENGFAKLRSLSGWGNGRDANQVWELLRENRSCRIHSGKFDGLKEISVRDAEITMNAMVKGRTTPKTQNSITEVNHFKEKTDYPNYNEYADESTSKDINVKSEEISRNDPAQDNPAQKDCEENEDDENDELESYDDELQKLLEAMINVDRDPRISDQVWEELETAKHNAVTHLSKVKSHLESSDSSPISKKAKTREIKKVVEIQKKLKKMGKCIMGFAWIQVSKGWRCAGGSHFVSDSQLNKIC